MGSRKLLLIFFFSFCLYLWSYWFCLSFLNKYFFIDIELSWFLVLQTVLNLPLWRIALRHSVSGCSAHTPRASRHISWSIYVFTGAAADGWFLQLKICCFWSRTISRILQFYLWKNGVETRSVLHCSRLSSWCHRIIIRGKRWIWRRWRNRFAWKGVIYFVVVIISQQTRGIWKMLWQTD